MLTQKSRGRIGIFGLGSTGISLYMYFKDQIVINLYCDDDLTLQKNIFAERFGKSNLVPISDARWKSLGIIYVSPGVSPDHLIFSIAYENKIEISSDIDLFYENNINSKFICITGTNGKSSTTSISSQILCKHNKDLEIGGNIGIPVMSLPFKKAIYLLEISSFQIDLIKSLRPYISLCLNIAPDHLDRYCDMDQYILSKKKILDLSQIIVIGINNKYSENLYYLLTKNMKNHKKRIITFSWNAIYPFASDILVTSKNELVDNYFDYKIYSIPRLKGFFHYMNIAACYIISRLNGIFAKDFMDNLIQVNFLKHRLEYLGSKFGISFYNDSKATNSDSVKFALSSFRNIFWILGGLIKEHDFSCLDQYLSNVKKAYLIGENVDVLSEYLIKNRISYIVCYSLECAVERSIADASLESAEEINIILSPACASYDQFKNFQERGNMFTQYVTAFLNS